MAVDVKISVATPNITANTITVSDATGDYSTINLTGWESPNVARADYALFVNEGRIDGDSYTYLNTAFEGADSVSLDISTNEVVGYTLFAVPITTDGAATNDTYFATSGYVLYFKDSGGTSTIVASTDSIDESKIAANFRATEVVVIDDYLQKTLDVARSACHLTGDPTDISIKQILLNAANQDAANNFPHEADRILSTVLNM